MNTTYHNRKGVRRKTPEQRRKSEQRKLTIILITIVLIIFSFGTVFGFFLCTALAPEPVKAAELAKTETVVLTGPEQLEKPDVHTLEFESDGRKLDDELKNTMIDMCDKYDLPLALVLAVAEQESRFNPSEVSSTNDYGIMQINKVNFNWLREKGIEPLDNKGNIEAGVLILSEAVKKYGDYGLALMAYNCGDTGAKRLWKKGIYSSKYSRATMERFDKWDKYIRGV